MGAAATASTPAPTPVEGPSLRRQSYMWNLGVAVYMFAKSWPPFESVLWLCLADVLTCGLAVAAV